MSGKLSLSVQGEIQCGLEGFELLNSPIFNKGSAFTEEERDIFKLNGLLPPHVDDLEKQIERAYKQLHDLRDPLRKNDFMTSMRQQNKTLYYALVNRHISELVPIIYTPTEGDAIANYSNRFRRPEGVFLDITQPDTILDRMSKFGNDSDIDYIVVTDSEGILGIGDQGVGGIRISLAKLALMTLCGGIHPGRGLAVCLDVGTNNETLATDELYMGNRFARVRGKQYDDFVEKFINVLKEHYPSSVLHFEDFGVTNARPILEKYKSQLACFNDDIQGTGAVVMSSFLAALKHTSRDLKTAKVLIYGAGSAGLGIADQIVNHMVNHGLTKEQARNNIYAMDRHGLILDSMGDVSYEAQMFYSKKDEDFKDINTKSLVEVVGQVKPTCMIGCSTQKGAFTEQVIREMYKHNDKPIIFPLSNPTRLVEAVPEDLLKWTDFNALVATGSPFQPVEGYNIAQNNNCFSFPGIGLGAVVCKASTISDTMISAAVDQLADLAPINNGDPKLGLLPSLDLINELSSKIAAAVVLQAVKEGVAQRKDIPLRFEDTLKWVESQMWRPVYRPMKKTLGKYTHQI